MQMPFAMMEVRVSKQGDHLRKAMDGESFGFSESIYWSLTKVQANSSKQDVFNGRQSLLQCTCGP